MKHNHQAVTVPRSVSFSSDENIAKVFGREGGGVIPFS